MNKMINPGKCPEEIKKYYNKITDTYQVAFAGWPWYEVSKCVDSDKQCQGGFSELDVGEYCSKCQLCITEPAYSGSELVKRFDEIGATRPSRWYLELCENEVALASLAWRAGAAQIIEEKYDDRPEMRTWLAGQLPFDQDIIWLDEVFANKQIRPDRNLDNFVEMIRTFMEELELPRIAYRTINPQMLSVADRFGSNARTYNKKENLLPDERDFVIINSGEKS